MRLHGAVYQYGQDISFIFSAEDDESGVTTLDATLDGETITSGETRDDLNVGSHTLTVTATNGAGISATASVTFTVVNTPGTVTAGGWIELEHKKGSCGFQVSYTEGDPTPTGQMQYTDHDLKMDIHSTSILGFGVVGQEAYFCGECTIDGVPGYLFWIEVIDNGEPGSNDEFYLWLDTGYSAGGSLGGGNITIH